MFRYLLLLAALLCFGQSGAQTTDQNYPVTAQAFVVAQPNQKLAAYFSSSRALTVSLLLKDLTKTSVQAYLRWSIDGPGVHIASVDGHIPAHFITLQRGVMQRLSGQDLQSDYFLSNQILAEGLAGPPLRTSLPEGFYTFRVQALEAGTGREVSNWGETYFSITTPLPPVINIPFNGAELIPTEAQKNGVQPISIQWMPRHYRMPGNITSYDLKVCKVPDGYEPTESLEACVSPIIDDKGNPGTFYPGNTGIGNSIIGAFEMGEKYAARVTIHEFDQNGDEILFANEGRSEVTWFRFGKECISPASFTIKEVGPGRLQLTWDQLDGVDNYTVFYRKEGDNQWTSQPVAGTTTFIANLTPNDYELAVQASCSKQFPDNVQTWGIEDETDDWEELPLALTDPMQLPVQVAGCVAVTPGKLSDYYTNFPGQEPDLTKKLSIPTCALVSSTYTGCSDDHPVITPPTTGTELTELKTGDVLGIYDFTVFVAEAVATPEGFTGKGFVRLPFLEGTLLLADFSGVKVWKTDGNGGCVYESARFESKSQTQVDIASAMSKLMTTLAGENSPNTYAGTLAGALQQYDALSEKGDSSQICQYKAAILQASNEFKTALEEVSEEEPDPRITAILQDLEAITSQLQADSLLPNLTQKYEDLFARLELLKKQLQEENTPPDYQITNIQLSNLQMQSAKINWQLSGGEVTRYVVEYRDPGGATRIETLDSPQVNLQGLKENRTYTYKILAYEGDQIVATSPEGQFTTLAREVPRPENLTYTILSDKSVKITWDKNTQHKDFKLVYTDGKGNWQAVFPTTNEVTLTGLDPSQLYDYEIVAYDNARVESAAANSQVVTNRACLADIIGPKRVIQDIKFSLSMIGCRMLDRDAYGGRLPEVIWDGPGIKYSGEILSVQLQETTTFKATCILPNGFNGETISCTDSITIEVKKKCEGVIASVTPTLIERGQPVMLRSSGCEGEVEWRSGREFGQIETNSKTSIIYPNSSTLYSLSCIDNEDNKCFVEVGEVNVSCEFKLAVTNRSFYDPMMVGIWNYTNKTATVKAVGCSGEIVWERSGGNKRLSEDLIDKNTIKYTSIKKKFTVKATCKSTGCVARVDIEEPPTSNFCEDPKDFLIQKINENTREITLRLKSNHPFIWDDNTSDSIRVLARPQSTAVFSAMMTEKNCITSYAYEPTSISLLPLSCEQFSLVKSGTETIPYNSTSTKINLSATGCSNGVQTYPIQWKKKAVLDDEYTAISGTEPTKELVFTNSDVGKSFIISATCSLTQDTKSVTVSIKKGSQPTQPPNEPTTLQNPCDFYAYTQFDNYFNTFLRGDRIEINVRGVGSKLQAYIVNDVNYIASGTPIVTMLGDGKATIALLPTIYGIDKNGNGTYYGSFIIEIENTVTGDRTCRTQIQINVSPNRIYDPNYVSYTFDLSAKPVKEDCQKYAMGGREIPIINGTQANSIMILKSKNDLLNFGVISLYNDYIGRVYSPAISPERIGLVDKVCHGQGGVRTEWFRGRNGNGLQSPMPIERHSGFSAGVDSSPDFKNKRDYYARCTFKDGTYCVNVVTVNPLILGGARISTSEEEQDVTVLPCQYSKQKATELALSNLLCKKLSLLEGNERSKLEALRSELLLRGIELPIISDEMISNLSIGKCEETVKALTATITGNESVATLSKDLVNESTINSLLSNIVEAIDTIYVINSDFVPRQIETFDSEVQAANARADALGLCPLYYFDPAGKRIRIPDISNCVVSINGILMSFERNGQKYIPLYNQRTKAFIGYHKEVDFNRYATPANSSNSALSAPMGLLSEWIRNTEYPAENSRISRWISFIEENKGRPGVIQNYSDQTFIEVKLLMAQLPETIFDVLEGSESYYLFDLLKIKRKLQEILDTTNSQLVLLTQIIEEPESVCLEESSVICKILNCVYNNITGYQRRDLLNSRILLSTRKKLLTLLAQGMLTSGTLPGGCEFASDGEGIVLSLLQTTPEPDEKAILDHLRTTVPGTEHRILLKTFVDKIDGNNFISFISTLSEWIPKAYPRPKPFDIQTAAAQKRFLHFNDNWLGSINREEVWNDGTVRLTSRKLITGSDETYEITADPYDYILVTFENDFGVGELRFVKGEAYVLPAIYVYLLFNEDTWQAYKTSAEVTVMVGLTALGISEIVVAMEAGSVAGFVAGTIDLGLGIGDVVLSIAFKNEVDEVYPELADTWSKIAMCYGVGRLAVSGVNTLYRKAYVESRLAQYDFRLSNAARQKAGDMSQELQKPENFAEFANDINPILDDLADLRANNWVKGRRLSSESVNIQIVPGEGYPPYKFNTFVDDIEIGVGEKIYCVEYLDVRAINSNWADQPGGWMGTQLFNSEAEVRDALALLPEFKKEGFPLVIREYEVIKPVKARKGIVGGLTSKSNGKTYPGGGEQIQILDGINRSGVWDTYFKKQAESNGIREYLKILN